MIDSADITGLVLAGGHGSRMGGIDKGLQLHRGLPLAQHALRRLAPQVGTLMLSANRHLDAYRAMGVPVWPDTVSGHAGPLAGILTGLQHCGTPWLAVVPCDSPRFPRDLVARLAQAAGGADAEIATAATREEDDGSLLAQPVFCLIRRELLDGLARFVAEGGRKLGRWSGQQRRVLVAFDDAQAFANANTPDELAELERVAPHDD